MRALPFRILNVFAREEQPLSGNPLCVFDNGVGLSDGTMQALARQFPAAETTFVLPSAHADARVRIFTPTAELPFAGHPTLGAAHVCRALGLGGDTLRLEMSAGVISVEASGNRWTLTAIPPRWREVGLTRAAAANALGLYETDVAERPLWVYSGTEQLIVPLASPDAVRRAIPRLNREISFKSGQASGIYLFAIGGAQDTFARFFFFDGAKLVEDTATGAATANFAGWCIAMRQPLPLRYEILQGDVVARPSLLYLDIDRSQQVRISGRVTEIANGVVSLP